MYIITIMMIVTTNCQLQEVKLPSKLQSIVFSGRFDQCIKERGLSRLKEST